MDSLTQFLLTNQSVPKLSKALTAPSVQRIVWPITWSDSTLEPGPNRRPFKAVLFRSDVPSVRTPLGGRRPVRIHPSCLRSFPLDKLIGLPIHVVPTLDHHWIETDTDKPQFISIGVVVSAEVIGDGDAIIGEGYLWERDFPDLVKKVSEAGKRGELSVSWEIVNVEVIPDLENNCDWIVKFEPVGFAFLRAESAAYRDRMPVLAALKDKESYDPASLALNVLLDDHRLLHAFYSTLQSGEDFGDWTVSEVVSLHAKVVDEMLKRHVAHNRGDGVSRKLNDESLPKQKFKFFTDELEKSISGFVEVDESVIKRLRSFFDDREPIVIGKTVDIQASALAAIPEGKPFYLADSDRIFGIAAYAEIDGEVYLSVQTLYKEPIDRKLVSADFESFKSKAERAIATFKRLPEVIIIPGYLAVTGSSLVAENQNDLDILMLDSADFGKLRSQFAANFQVPIQITLTDVPTGLSIPAYDLILIKRDEVYAQKPPIDEDDLKLASIPTVRYRDDFVARRLRSLADRSDLFMPIAFAANPPVARSLLRLERDGESEWVADEGYEFPVPDSFKELPDYCNTIVAEIWLDEEGFKVADVLFWNATAVCLLPFVWRKVFVNKVSKILGLKPVSWAAFSTEQAFRQMFDVNDALVIQDGQAPYGAGRWLVAR